MKRTLIIFLSFFWLGNLSSQNWVNIIDSMPNSHLSVYTGVVDTITNTMYVGGDFQQINNFKTKAIIKYNGLTFDTLGAGLDPQWAGIFTPTIVRTSIMFQNKLYVGGQFEKAGKYFSRNLARWNGSDWDSTNFKVNSTVTNMTVYNNELYICGSFDTVCGVAANNVAKFDGTNWHSLNFPFKDLISDIAIFQDTLYATGAFYQSGFSVLAKYNKTTWVPWRGVTGDANKGIWGITVIDTMLFVYGRFWGIDGKTGNGLMGFNGRTWYSYGSGVTPTNYSYISNITKINGYLYITGNFEYINGISNSNNQLNYNTNTARFDGNKWCLYLPTIKFPVSFSLKYNNNVILGGGIDSVGTYDAFPLIKYTGGNSIIACSQSVGVGVNEINISENIKIYPNPTTSILNIEDQQNDLQNSTVVITNSLGEIVYSEIFQSEINIYTFPTGIYFLTVKSQNDYKTVKIIKQ
jgi:hypothetical protein